MKAVMFPGQGAQRPRMGANVFARYPEIVAQADAILGFSLKDVCNERPDLLNNTRYTQPALFVVSYLSYLDYEIEQGPPALLAGHSVGEFTALTAAGVLTFAQTLQLVNRRAIAMATVSGGGMAAILGLSRHRVEALLRESALDLELANENSPTQTVVAGMREDIDKLVNWSSDKDFRVVPLRVSGAFHTRWMKPAAADFVREIERLDFKPPRIPIVSNVTGALHGTDIQAAMARHLTSPVLWLKSIEYMLDFGITDFVEIGPSKVLSPLVNEIRNARRTIAPRSPGNSRGLAIEIGTRENSDGLARNTPTNLIGPFAARHAQALLRDWTLPRDCALLVFPPSMASGPAQAGEPEDRRFAYWVDYAALCDAERPIEIPRRSHVVIDGFVGTAADVAWILAWAERMNVVRLTVTVRDLYAAERVLLAPALVRSGSIDLCVDLQNWCDADDGCARTLELRATLAKRTPSAAIIPIGIRIADAAPTEVRRLRTAGAAFMVCGAPFAYSLEAHTESARRQDRRFIGPSQLPDARLPEFNSATRVLDASADLATCLAEISACYAAPPRTLGERLAWFEDFQARQTRNITQNATDSPFMQSIAPRISIADVQGDQAFRRTLRRLHAEIWRYSRASASSFCESGEGLTDFIDWRDQCRRSQRQVGASSIHDWLFN